VNNVAERVESVEERTPECEMQQCEAWVGVFEDKRNDGCDADGSAQSM